MDQMPRADDAVEVAVDRTVAGGLGRRGTPHGSFRRFLRGFIHFLSYHLISRPAEHPGHAGSRLSPHYPPDRQNYQSFVQILRQDGDR